jgi:RNase P/RNase MRP subunit POP5
MKLKTRPSSRIKKRYLLIQGSKEDVERAILDYLGILGYAKASPMFIQLKKSKDKIVLAIDRKELDDVRAAFELFKGIKILSVSGTIKGLGYI